MSSISVLHWITKVAGWLVRLLLFLLALLLCIPVILLPFATATPAWVWIPLALACIALLVLYFWLKPAWQGAAVSVAGVLLVGVLAVMALQASAMWLEYPGAGALELRDPIAASTAGSQPLSTPLCEGESNVAITAQFSPHQMKQP